MENGEPAPEFCQQHCSSRQGYRHRVTYRSFAPDPQYYRASRRRLYDDRHTGEGDMEARRGHHLENNNVLNASAAFRVDVCNRRRTVSPKWKPIRGGNNTNRADDEGIHFLRILAMTGGEPSELTACNRAMVATRGWVLRGVSAVLLLPITGGIEAPDAHAMSLMADGRPAPRQIDLSAGTAPAVILAALPLTTTIVQACQCMDEAPSFEDLADGFDRIEQ